MDDITEYAMALKFQKEMEKNERKKRRPLPDRDAESSSQGSGAADDTMVEKRQPPPGGKLGEHPPGSIATATAPTDELASDLKEVAPYMANPLPPLVIDGPTEKQSKLIEISGYSKTVAETDVVSDTMFSIFQERLAAAMWHSPRLK